MGKTDIEAAIGTLDTLIQVFAVLVAIGIVGEVGFGVRHWILSRRLHNIQQSEDLERTEEIAKLNKEAGDARKAAGEAVERAGNAEENIAKANERAALAEQHTAEIQASLKPRRLTAEQKAKLVSLLKPFSNLPITLEWVGSGTQEVADLASDMFDTITSAGITIPNKNILMGEYFRGVQLKVGNDRRAEAEIIGGFLIEAGLSGKPVPARPEPNAQNLAIVIGSKP
jgi:hypothetical protein